MLNDSDNAAFQWRQDLTATYLQRDLPEFGVRVPAETLCRFWTMLAHMRSQLFSASKLGRSLGGASHSPVGRYLDALIAMLMVRRLEPRLAGVGKRQVKSPKVYVRDGDLLHAPLGLATVRQLQGHPVAGASWGASSSNRWQPRYPGAGRSVFSVRPQERNWTRWYKAVHAGSESRSSFQHRSVRPRASGRP